jgi:hypothetical protein
MYGIITMKPPILLMYANSKVKLNFKNNKNADSEYRMRDYVFLAF